MRKYSIISFISLIFILLSCTSGKQLTQVSDEGAVAMKAGDYNKALQAYQQLIADYEKKGKADECPYYGQAGKAAFALGNTDKAIIFQKRSLRLKTALRNILDQPISLLNRKGFSRPMWKARTGNWQLNYGLK